MRPDPEKTAGCYREETMEKILCLETATTNCSVALFDGDEPIASLESNDGGYSHGEKLHVFIRQVLAQGGISPRELSAVAVSRGPGSYTGLRIGVSSAKGLAYALEIPLLSVGTLAIMARIAREETSADYLVPMLDARRMEVYTAVYDRDLQEVSPVEALIVRPGAYASLSQTGKMACFFGDGMDKCRDLLGEERFSFLPGVFPSALAMGTEALSRLREHCWEDVAYFEPYYLKDFVGGHPAEKK